MSSKNYFDTVAENWDDMREGFFSEAVRDAALAKAAVRAGAIAADIGAGTGFITEALLTAGLRVIAVDQSETMLRVMRQKFGDSLVEYRADGSQALPLQTGEVDYAFANMYLHHVDDPAAAIREMARIVRPGGSLVITDLDTHNFQFLVEEQHDRWMGFAREDMTRWLIEAGLTTVEVTDAGCNCCTTSACGTCDASVSIFLASGRK